MANARYDNMAEILLGEAATRLDFDTDTIRITLFDAADDTMNLAVDDFYDDMAAGAKVAVVTLSSVTIVAGVVDSADPVFTAVTGDVCEEIHMWKDTTVASTSPLIMKYDTFTSGMPVTPNGGNINVTVHASGWFNI